MPVNNPTPTEIAISQNMQRIIRKIISYARKRIRADVHVTVFVMPGSGADGDIVSYASSVDRESSALMLLEVLARWAADEKMKPLHELRDAKGRSLQEILGAGPH